MADDTVKAERMSDERLAEIREYNRLAQSFNVRDLLAEVERLRAVEAERDALAAKAKEQSIQLRALNESAREKNLQLDALHFVWCSGGCEGGAHRFTTEKVTPEIVREAVRNTSRLVTWFINATGKADEAYPAGWQEAFERVERKLWERDAAREREGRMREVLARLVEATRAPCRDEECTDDVCRFAREARVLLNAAEDADAKEAGQ